MDVNEFLNCLDFEENNYYYHVTGNGKSDFILEEGLLVDGTNITGTNNLLYTTAAPIYPEDACDEETFIANLLDGELSDNDRNRDKNEMVIIAKPKEMRKKIVTHFGNYVDGVYYEGIIDNSFIMGYFNIDHEFIPNDHFEYGNDAFYDDNHFTK